MPMAQVLIDKQLQKWKNRYHNHAFGQQQHFQIHIVRANHPDIART
jgi:hypothetical protein